MVVDEDEDEEGAHICPIMCAELLSGENFNCLEGRQNWDTKLGYSRHPIIWTI
jgi:hypothetical protein